MTTRQHALLLLYATALAGCAAPPASESDHDDQSAVTSTTGGLHSPCSYHSTGKSDCNAGLTCRPTTLKYNYEILWCPSSFDNYRCEYGARVNEICENDTNCASGLLCAHPNLVECAQTSRADYVCRPPGSTPSYNGKNETTTLCKDDRECASGYCNKSFSVPHYVEGTSFTPGFEDDDQLDHCTEAPCTSDDQCSDREAPLCIKGACVARFAAGSACAGDYQCQDKLLCQSGLCAAL